MHSQCTADVCSIIFCLCAMHTQHIHTVLQMKRMLVLAVSALYGCLRRQVGGRAKAATAAQKQRQELTLALLPSLPQLLRRFQTDPHKVRRLSCSLSASVTQPANGWRHVPVS